MDYNEHTAVDTEVMELVQPATEVTSGEVTAVENTATATEPETTTEVVETTPATVEYDIEGVGKLTLEEIKELRQGGLRQSD